SGRRLVSSWTRATNGKNGSFEGPQPLDSPSLNFCPLLLDPEHPLVCSPNWFLYRGSSFLKPACPIANRWSALPDGKKPPSAIAPYGPVWLSDRALSLCLYGRSYPPPIPKPRFRAARLCDGCCWAPVFFGGIVTSCESRLSGIFTPQKHAKFKDEYRTGEVRLYSQRRAEGVQAGRGVSVKARAIMSIDSARLRCEGR